MKVALANRPREGQISTQTLIRYEVDQRRSTPIQQRGQTKRRYTFPRNLLIYTQIQPLVLCCINRIIPRTSRSVRTDQEQQVEAPIREPLPENATTIPDRAVRTISLVQITPVLVLGRMRRCQHLVLFVLIVS